MTPDEVIPPMIATVLWDRARSTTGEVIADTPFCVILKRRQRRGHPTSPTITIPRSSIRSMVEVVR